MIRRHLLLFAFFASMLFVANDAFGQLLRRNRCCDPCGRAPLTFRLFNRCCPQPSCSPSTKCGQAYGAVSGPCGICDEDREQLCPWKELFKVNNHVVYQAGDYQNCPTVIPTNELLFYNSVPTPGCDTTMGGRCKHMGMTEEYDNSIDWSQPVTVNSQYTVSSPVLAKASVGSGGGSGGGTTGFKYYRLYTLTNDGGTPSNPSDDLVIRLAFETDEVTTDNVGTRNPMTPIINASFRMTAGVTVGHLAFGSEQYFLLE